MSHRYVQEPARGVRWDDPARGIEWQPADERISRSGIGHLPTLEGQRLQAAQPQAARPGMEARAAGDVEQAGAAAASLSTHSKAPSSSGVATARLASGRGRGGRTAARRRAQVHRPTVGVE